MMQLDKARLLKLLYQYRAMGFEYFKEYKTLQNSNSTMDLDWHSLENLANSCFLCNLSKRRNSVVFGEGNKSAKLMFVAENPRASEDKLGRVFAGQAGDMITKIIEKVLGQKREDVYIAYIVKCKTPDNRVPSIEEASACKPYLLQQIKLINPEIIVSLGSTSFHHLTGEYNTHISQIRGEILSFGNAKLIPTLCPYFLLRNPSSKKEVFQDMLKVKSLL